MLRLYRDTTPVDLALVDLAISTDNVIGARAIWDVSRLHELFLTRAQPWSIGLSAIGGMLHPLEAASPAGLHVVFGEQGRSVKAAIGPGLFASVHVQSVHEMSLGERIALQFDRAVTLAFDGERDMTAGPQDALVIELDADGPWVIDTRRAITDGVRQ